MKRLLVTGSRSWTDRAVIARALIDVDAEWGVPRDAVLVHGGARGADLIAADVWAGFGMTVEAHPADWDRYGQRAGYVRNAEMVRAGAHLCLAFIVDGSRGATMCAQLAEEAGIPVRRFEVSS